MTNSTQVNFLKRKLIPKLERILADQPHPHLAGLLAWARTQAANSPAADAPKTHAPPEYH